MGVPIVVQQKWIWLGTMKFRVWSLASLSGLRNQCCGVGRRHGSDPTLLWLWCRLVATVPIRPLAWEIPYAVAGVAQEMAKRQKKKKKKSEKSLSEIHRCQQERFEGTLYMRHACSKGAGAISGMIAVLICNVEALSMHLLCGVLLGHFPVLQPQLKGAANCR